jgi:hypothetical protein
MITEYKQDARRFGVLLADYAVLTTQQTVRTPAPCHSHTDSKACRVHGRSNVHTCALAGLQHRQPTYKRVHAELLNHYESEMNAVMRDHAERAGEGGAHDVDEGDTRHHGNTASPHRGEASPHAVVTVRADDGDRSSSDDDDDDDDAAWEGRD